MNRSVSLCGCFHSPRDFKGYLISKCSSAFCIISWKSLNNYYSRPHTSGNIGEQKGRRPGEEGLGKRPENIFTVVHWILNNYVPSYASLTVQCTTVNTEKWQNGDKRRKCALTNGIIIECITIQEKPATNWHWQNSSCELTENNLENYQKCLVLHIVVSLEREGLAKVLPQLTSWSQGGQDCKGNQYPKESFGVRGSTITQTILIYI